MMKLKLLVIVLGFLSQDMISQDDLNPSDLSPQQIINLTTAETTSYFGNSVSFSADGNVIAIGEYGYSSEESISSGRVKVYENLSGDWILKGQEITGVNDFFNAFGKKVVLSSDGSTLAVYDSQISIELQAGQTLEDLYGELAPQYFPYVQVYQYTNGTWTQVGDNFLFDNITAYSDMSFSGDGSTLAIATKVGIDIYEFNGTTWVASGQQISVDNNVFEVSVGLSDNGEILVVGNGYYNDSNSSDNPSYEGRVAVYESLANTWVLLGSPIIGLNYLEYFGSIVDISADGYAIAVATAQTNGDDQVKIYEFISANWVQKGSSIVQSVGEILSLELANDANAVAIGEHNAARVLEYNEDWSPVNKTISSDSSSDDFGHAIAIANGGELFAVGAPSITTTNSNGYVNIFGTNKNSLKRFGEEIYGNATYDGLGNSVDMSDDGNIIAIGASGRYQSQAYSRVVIYEKTPFGVQQIGSEILNPSSGLSAFGAVVKLSANGNLLAVSDPLLYNSNYGVVYTYQRIGDNWVEYADPIYGEYGSRTGSDLEFSNDGTILAVGSGGNPGGVSGDQYTGYTEVYQFDAVASSWVQLGERITGEATSDYSGSAIGLSGDGTVIVIGAYGNDGETTNNGSHGHVRIFEYENDNWNQMGSDLDGDPAFHVNFGSVVVLSNDGETVMIGDPNSQSQAGSVELYNWNSSNAQWEFEVRLKTYQGSGPNNGHRFQFGSAIDMSHDGRVLVIGERDWNPPSASNNGWGKVHVYTKDTQEWSKNELVLEGRMRFQYFGGALSLSANGSTLAVGGRQFGTYTNEVPDYAGMVGVYHLNLCSTLENFEVYDPQPLLIPDPNFEQALIDLGYDTDATLNGQMSASDAFVVTELDVSSQNISDLTGIEGFSSLEVLMAFNNDLVEVDLSRNTKLNTILLALNNLEEIDLSNNPDIISLSLNSNNLEDIDLSNNLLLTQVFLNENNLIAIDVSLLSNLQNLGLSDNSIVELDISQNSNVTTLFCNNNVLASLIVNNGNNSNFTNFEAQNNTDLFCITVDDITFSTNNWTNIDPQSFFGLDCAPDNDDCFDAGILDLGTVVNGTTFGSTSSSSFPSCQENTIVLLDVWYQFTAPSSGAITAVAASTLNNLGINMAIYDDCNDVEPISCDSGTIEVTDLIPGQTYFIQIWVGGSVSGRFTSSLSDEFTLNVQDTSTLSNTSFIASENNLKLYPNPAKDGITISSNNRIDSYQILDVTGKIVLSNSQEQRLNYLIDVNSLSKGIYLIKIKIGNTSVIKKLLIK